MAEPLTTGPLTTGPLAPEPSASRPNALWQVRADGAVVLLASSCPECGRSEFPGLATCMACGTAAAPATLGPEATLAGFTQVLHQPPDAKVRAPYTVAVAAFDAAGIAVLGLLDRYPDGEQLTPGARLHVTVLDYDGGSCFAFRLGNPEVTTVSGPPSHIATFARANTSTCRGSEGWGG